MSKTTILNRDYIGILIFIFGFLLETIADWQKHIWRYSRHANYFGEVVLWYGIFILCCGAVGIGHISYFCKWPLIPYLGSGVALSETNAQKRYGDRSDFQAYCASTSKIIFMASKKDQFSWFGGVSFEIYPQVSLGTSHDSTRCLDSKWPYLMTLLEADSTRNSKSRLDSPRSEAYPQVTHNALTITRD